MGDLGTILGGVQQAAQAPPPPPPPEEQKEKPDVTGFQNVLGGVKAQATGQPAPITTNEDAVMASMLKKREAMKDAHQTLLDNSATRILAAGGQSIADVGKAILTPRTPESILEEEKEIYKSVPINGEDTWLKSIGKDVIREGIRTYGAAGDVANRVMMAYFGPGLAVIQGTLAGAGKESDSNLLSGAADAMNDPAMMMILHQVQGIPVHDIVTKPPLPHDVLRAIDNGIIEPSEPDMKGEAAQYVNAQALPKDIHEAARQIAPEVFNEYDALHEQHQILSDQMREASTNRQAEIEASAPHTQEIEQLKNRLETEDLSDRKTQRLQERIEDLSRKNQDFIDEQGQKLPPEMETIRQSQEAIRARLSEIADTGALRAAYQVASSRMPHVETVEPEAPKAAEIPPAESVATKETQVITDSIAKEVEQKLLSAGRPKEEAQAQSKIVGSFFDTLAKVYPAKGTAQEIYAREGANINGDNKRPAAKELAQTEQTKVGEQHIIPGAEKISDKELAERKMEGRMKPKTAQRAADEGLFGDAHKQGELFQKMMGAFRHATDYARATIRLAKSADASTFIHESAHHFLDIIQRYAREEDAPEALKSDMRAVEKWLKVPEGTDFRKTNEKGRFAYRKEHEKFARGFEQYVREGIAPTKELAGVFAKFKTWLTDIYKTVKSLGAPISDDIKGVFDRLLTEKPERTVIAPEKEAKPVPTISEEEKPASQAASEPVKEASATGGVASAPAENKPAVKTGGFQKIYKTIPRKPPSLIDWVKRRGGVKDAGGNLAAAIGKAERGLIRPKAGSALDEMALYAWEEGYFPEKGNERPSINEFLDKLIHDQTHHDQYSSKHQAEMDAYNDALAHNEEVNRLVDTLGISLADKTHDEFWNEVREKLSVDEMARDSDSLQSKQEALHAEAEKKEKEWLESRGDAWEPVEEKTRSLEDLENEYQSEKAAAGPQASAEVSGPSRPSAGDTGSIQEVAGQGDSSAGTRPKPSDAGKGSERGGTGERPEPKSKPVEKLFDKAGNIRLENLTNDEEVRSALRVMAQKYPEALNHEVVSDTAVAEMARELGVKNPDKAIEKLRGMAAEDGVPLASYVRAAREMLANAHDEAIAFAEKVEGGTRADFLNAMQAKDRFMMLASTVSETANELGRALRAFQDISGAKASAMELNELFQQAGTTEGEMKDLFQLIASKKAPGMRGQAAKVMQAAAKPGFWDTFAEYRRCSILSGWVTHSLWLAGTGVNLAYKGLVLDTLGGLHNELRMLAGGKDTGSRVTGGFEGLARTITKALPNILSATGTAIRTGKTVLRPFEGEFDTYLATGGIRKTLNVNMDALKKAVDEGFNENDHADLKVLRERLDKIPDGVTKDAIQKTLDEKTAQYKGELTQVIAARMQNRLKSWGELRQEMSDFGSSVLSGIEAVGKNMVSPDFYKGKPLLEAKRNGGAVPDIYVKGVPVAPVGTALRSASSVIYSSMHTFTREIAANVEVAQEARRIAVEEGAKDVEGRRNELLADPNKELMQRVNHIANKQTLMSNESQFAKMMTGFRNRMDEWGSKTFGANKLGTILFPVIGVPAEAAAQTVVENSVFGLAFKGQRDALMGKHGALAQERAQVKMLAGSALTGLGFWLASEGMTTPSPSINFKQEQERRDAGKQSGSIRAGDWMVSLAHVPITGTILTLGADLHHMMDIHFGADESEKIKPAFASAINNFFLHENALVEMTSLIDMMRGKTDPAAYLKNQATSLIPQFISQTNNVLDPLQRDSKSFMASLMSRIPGESKSLEPRINALTGEPLEREPFHIASATPDPIAENLMSLHIYPANPKPSINGVDLSSHRAAEYSVVKGHILHSGMQMLMQGDGAEDFRDADNDGKRKMAQKIERHAANCAKSVMFNKYPELLKDANDKYEKQCRDEIE